MQHFAACCKANEATVTLKQDELAAALKGAFVQTFHDVLNPKEIWISTDVARLLCHQTEK